MSDLRLGLGRLEVRRFIERVRVASKFCHSEANAEESAFSLLFSGFRFFRAFAIYGKADFSLRSK